MEELKISRFAYERERAKDEKTVRRLVAALILVIVLWFATIGMFVLYLGQYNFVDETSTITVEAKEGVANYIGNDGDIINGEDYSEKDKARP